MLCCDHIFREMSQESNILEAYQQNDLSRKLVLFAFDYFFKILLILSQQPK